MQINESNYVFEAEDIICDLERTDKLIQVLFEELDDAHSAVLDADKKIAGYWLFARKDIMQAILYSARENVSKVCAQLQKWVDNSLESGE